MTDTEERLEMQWREVYGLTSELLIEQLDNRDMGSKYLMMLNDLRHDKIMPKDVVVLGMYRTPASKERHHNIVGGLTLHLLEMYHAWQNMRDSILPSDLHPIFTESNVWRAILHHDLNKVWRYTQVSHVPFKVDYYQNDKPTALLGNAHKSSWILQSYGIKLSLPLYNALVCAEGGFSETRTRAETVFAKMIYLLDELSANVLDRLNTNRYWDSKDGGLDEADKPET